MSKRTLRTSLLLLLVARQRCPRRTLPGVSAGDEPASRRSVDLVRRLHAARGSRDRHTARHRYFVHAHVRARPLRRSLRSDSGARIRRRDQARRREQFERPGSLAQQQRAQQRHRDRSVLRALAHRRECERAARQDGISAAALAAAVGQRSAPGRRERHGIVRASTNSTGCN